MPAAPKMRRTIVVDADVLRSASTRPVERAERARSVLSAIREEKHSIVVNDPLVDEYLRHQSQYSASWLTSMRSERLLVSNGPVQLLSPSFGNLSPQAVAAIGKDWHLVAAAHSVSEDVIITFDVAFRSAWEEARLMKNGLPKICIVDAGQEGIDAWIRAGARTADAISRGLVE